MKLRTIHIENFRAYKEFNCEFDKDAFIDLVIGDNGAGKTSLLAAISQLLSIQISDFGGGLGLEPEDPHLETKKVGDSTVSVTEGYPIIISGDIENEDGTISNFRIVREDYYSKKSEGLTSIIKGLTEKNDSIWPLISYQRFDREWKIGKNKGKTIAVDTGLNDRKEGYLECLKGIGQDEKIQKWCLKMSMMAFERKSTIQEFERFKHIIKTFLQVIEDRDDDFEISYSMEYSGLAMKSGDTIEPLYELSTGYKAILSMIMELAYRTVLLNPTAQIESTDQTGIVIIDEIDAHLHPKWQWRVIDALRKCFPKVQFIIATHSPIVIASAKDAKMIVLEEKGQFTSLDDAYGYNVSDVLDLRQGSAAVPKELAECMERLERAMDEEDFALADKEVSDAKAKYGEDSSVYKELKTYLDINRWVESN